MMACELKMSADGKFHLYMLDRMRQQHQFFDVKIIMKRNCGGSVSVTKIVEAHKCVLASSGYFFYSKLKRNDTNKIDFDLGKEFWNASDLIAVVEFLYTGSITLRLDNILNITYLARLFGMTILENLCDKYAAFFLSEKTFLPLYIALISNKKAICVSQKMMQHRDRLGEFVQTVFFSQLIENEQLKKLTSQQMLLLLENIVFADIRSQEVIPVIKLAVNWPLWHKDADSLKVCQLMISSSLSIRLSDLSHVQRVEVEKLLQSADKNARMYYETCGAKFAVQFETYIQKAIEYVFGEIDENEFNKVTDVRVSTRTSADKDNKVPVVPVECLIANTYGLGMSALQTTARNMEHIASFVVKNNTERNIENDTQIVVEKNHPVINPAFLFKTKLNGDSCAGNESNCIEIKDEANPSDEPGVTNDVKNKIQVTGKVDDAADALMRSTSKVGHVGDMIHAPTDIEKASEVIHGPSVVSDASKVIHATSVDSGASATSLELDHNAESDFEIKIELDVDSDECDAESGKYTADQTELLIDTMKNNPHNYYASGVMSGIARHLSMSTTQVNVGMDQVNRDENILSEIYKKNKTEPPDHVPVNDVDIMSEIYQNRKREHSDSMCSKRTRSKLLNKTSKSSQNHHAGTSDRLGVTEGPSVPKHHRKDETRNIDQLGELNLEKNGKNIPDDYLPPTDSSNTLVGGKTSDLETVSADEETVRVTDSVKDISKSDLEHTVVINAEGAEEGESEVKVENNFYEYVLDQISHNIGENT